MNFILPLTIGCINIDVILSDRQLRDSLVPRYALFIRERGSGFPASIRWQPAAGDQATTALHMEYLPGRIDLSAPGEHGQILFDQGAELQISTLQPIPSIDYFLRVITAELVFQSGGLLFHGAGILHRNKGYVFFGHSGSGKTTVSSLSLNDIVLNDDLLVLTPSQRGWDVYATPFWNPTQVKPDNRSMPLNGLYRLVKDRTVFLKPMTTAQAVGEMIANTPVVTANASRLPEVLARCQRISLAIPSFWLHFLKDDSFWTVIDGV